MDLKEQAKLEHWARNKGYSVRKWAEAHSIERYIEDKKKHKIPIYELYLMDLKKWMDDEERQKEPPLPGQSSGGRSVDDIAIPKSDAQDSKEGQHER